MQSISLIIVALALIPVIVLMIVMLVRDKSQPEPFPWLLRGVFFGVLSAFASMFISGPLIIPEETAKLFFLWLLLRKNPYFDEHLDGIVYAVCIGLGFAAIENVEYLFSAGDAWLETGIVRGLLAVPAHFFFAVLMGYYYSLVHFGHAVRRNRMLVWAVPVLAHGIYDTIAMSQSVQNAIMICVCIKNTNKFKTKCII